MSDELNQRMGTDFEMDYVDEDTDDSEEDEYWDMERQHRQE